MPQQLTVADLFALTGLLKRDALGCRQILRQQAISLPPHSVVGDVFVLQLCLGNLRHMVMCCVRIELICFTVVLVFRQTMLVGVPEVIS